MFLLIMEEPTLYKLKNTFMKKNRWIIIFFFILLISCEKEEKAIDVIGCTDPLASNYNQFANISNNSNCNYESYSTTIPLTSNYQNQIFLILKIIVLLLKT